MRPTFVNSIPEFLASC